MKLLSILLILSLVVMTFGGSSKKSSGSGSGSKKSSGSGPGSKKSSTSTSKKASSNKKSSASSSWDNAPSPRTPLTTDYMPTNDELCGCYQLDLVCAPIVNNDEICYYYLITADSGADYCEPISTLTLNTDNDCGITSADIDELLLDYAPKCYDIDPLDADGIKLTLDSRPSKSNYGGASSTKSGGSSSTKSGGSSSTKSGGASSSKTGSTSSYKTDTKSDSSGGSSSGSKQSSGSSSTKSDGGSNSAPSSGQEDYIIFSMCFKSDEVGGFNQNGQIGYGTPRGGSYTCDTPDLPNFCGITTTTEAVTTESPDDVTTQSPDVTTPSPDVVTTSVMTTTEATTPSPVTAQPTTDQPTTVNPTTSQPSVAPTFVECTAGDAYNIAFLLDESGSVSSSEWDIIKNFVKRLIDFDVSPSSYVSLYEFQSLPGFDRFLNFTGPKATEQAAMERALDRNRYSTAGQTETWDAVNRVLDDFYDYTIDPANQARGNILFLVTDGNPTDAAGDPTDDSYISDEYNTCDYIQNRLETQFPNNYIDVAILVIDPDSNVDIAKIDCLDYYNNQQDIIPIESFGSAAFTEIEERIREKICTDGLVPSEGAGPGTAVWTYPDGNVGLGPIPDASGGGRDCSNDPGAGPCTTPTP